MDGDRFTTDIPFYDPGDAEPRIFTLFFIPFLDCPAASLKRKAQAGSSFIVQPLRHFPGFGCVPHLSPPSTGKKSSRHRQRIVFIHLDTEAEYFLFRMIPVHEKSRKHPARHIRYKYLILLTIIYRVACWHGKYPKAGEKRHKN